MSRLNQALFALLILQAGAVGWQLVGGGSQAAVIDRGLLMPDLVADDITAISVRDGPEEDAQSVTLKREGGMWTVDEQHGHRADADKVDKLLRDLSGLEIADVVSTSGLHDVDLEVAKDAYQRRVTLDAPGGRTTLYIGSSARGGSVHARLGSNERIVAVRDFSAYRVSARPESWLDRAVIDVVAADVSALEIARPDHPPLALKRDGDAWTVSEGERAGPAQADAATSLVDDVVGLKLTKVAGTLSGDPEGALLEVTLTTQGADGAATSQGYRVARSGDDGGYLVVPFGGDHMVQVAAAAIDKLMDIGFEDLAAGAPPDEAAGDEGDATPSLAGG